MVQRGNWTDVKGCARKEGRSCGFVASMPGPTDRGDSLCRCPDYRLGSVNWLNGRRASTMSTSRVYASWLPPNTRERTQLLRVKRKQRLVIAWMLSLIPSCWVAVLLAPEGAVAALTLLWIGVGLWFAELVAAIRCPRCDHDFCGKREVACWYGLFANQCTHCGLTLERTAE